MYAQAKIYGCLVNKAGSFGCSDILTKFVPENFLEALFFGVRSFGHIFRSDQLWCTIVERLSFEFLSDATCF